MDTKETEINCLESVRKSYINDRVTFSNVDRALLDNMFATVEQNPAPFEFPDFTFSGGIIEHFGITASKETKKGSTYKIEQHKRASESEEKLRQFMNARHEFGKLDVQVIENRYEAFSYLDFIASLRRNVESHLASLRKSNLGHGLVVFLIEQYDAPLWIGNHNGHGYFYQVHNDKNVIDFFRQEAPDVHLIFFTSAEFVELIDLRKTISFETHSLNADDIGGGRLIEIDLFAYLNLSDDSHDAG